MFHGQQTLVRSTNIIAFSYVVDIIVMIWFLRSRVLVKESDLENTTYEFALEDGSTIKLRGNEEVEYDGELHTAANLFDASKEGYYGKF